MNPASFERVPRISADLRFLPSGWPILFGFRHAARIGRTCSQFGGAYGCRHFAIRSFLRELERLLSRKKCGVRRISSNIEFWPEDRLVVQGCWVTCRSRITQRWRPICSLTLRVGSFDTAILETRRVRPQKNKGVKKAKGARFF